MANPFDHLAVLAEVSIGFIGFVAIFLIFARREGRFSPEDAIRIQALFTAGFVGVFMSLLPIVLSNTVFDESLNWRISSIVFLFIVVGILVGIGLQQRRLPKEAQANIPLWNNLIAWGLGFVAMSCLLANALSLELFTPAFLYLVAILFILIGATTNFVAIAIQKLL